jgi:DNA-binding NarL/FixJ family response regulator
LFDAIETVMADTSWFSRGLIEKLANLRRPDREGADGSAPNLTVRERQILNLICSGLDDDAIARKLSLSRNTVRNHGAALYRKLGIHKRSEAVVWGRENGFPLSIPADEDHSTGTSASLIGMDGRTSFGRAPVVSRTTKRP